MASRHALATHTRGAIKLTFENHQLEVTRPAARQLMECLVDLLSSPDYDPAEAPPGVEAVSWSNGANHAVAVLKGEADR